MIIEGKHYKFTKTGPEPVTTFTLEDAIQGAWSSSEDLKLLADTFYDGDLSHDEIHAALDGLSILMNARFLKLWEAFEGCLKNEEFRAGEEKNSR